MIDKVSFKGFLTSTNSAKLSATRGIKGFTQVETNQIFDRIYLNKLLLLNPEDIVKTSRLEDTFNGDIITLHLKDGSIFNSRTNWVSSWTEKVLPNTTIKNYWSVHSESVPVFRESLEQIYSRFAEISEKFKK